MGIVPKFGEVSFKTDAMGCNAVELVCELVEFGVDVEELFVYVFMSRP